MDPPLRMAWMAAALALCGCADDPLGPPGQGSSCALQMLTATGPRRMDLLFVVDDSASMADKSAVLELAVVDLTQALSNPPCRTDSGELLPPPADPSDECPPQTERAYRAVADLHVGIIGSSLGGHGSDACPDRSSAHLVDAPSDQGCGYEAPLEAWYRFLVDPVPPSSIEIVEGKATPVGVDELLLAQRADFLRPDTELAVVMIGDENDCSVRDDGQYHYALQQTLDGAPFRIPRARSECQRDPSDPCCKSCAQPAGECPADAMCEASPWLTEEEDPLPLRCFDQKRRFGIDFLYPTERYVHALTEASINPADDRLEGSPAQPNPIYMNLQGDGRGIRSPAMVSLIAIVGVPWQDIARDPSDLTRGFKVADELHHPASNGLSTWDIILGDPQRGIPPADPLMRESIVPRVGNSPIVGVEMAPPGSAPDAHPVNGHEHARTDELQYACVFDLDESRDCNAVTEPADGVDKRCSCRLPADGAPHCDPAEATRQLRGRVYPGLRQIEVVRRLEAQGGLGSSCPAQTSDPRAADFAYRPALRLLTEDLLLSLAGQCLPRSLALDQRGQVACLVIEARRAGDEGCTCSDGRVAVSPEHAPMVDGILEHEIQQQAQWDCFCEVPQLEGAAQSACREDLSDAPLSTDGSPVDGFCYVDASTNPPVGNPELVSQCPEAQRYRLRFVGQAEIAAGATVFMMCCT